MDNTTRLGLERNIFHAAHQACDPWDQFLWHTSRGAIDTHGPHASQALAIDVFGRLCRKYCAETKMCLWVAYSLLSLRNEDHQPKFVRLGGVFVSEPRIDAVAPAQPTEA
jgi:hypothetical protein